MVFVRKLPRPTFCRTKFQTKLPCVRGYIQSIGQGRVTRSLQSEQHVIVGAGLAGLATAYLLLQSARAGTAVHIIVYDVGSIGNGASGAAAGLLHPFQPRGKLTWKGLEGLEACQRLLRVSQDALLRREGGEPAVPRRGVLRLGSHARETWQLSLFLEQLQAHPDDWRIPVKASEGGRACSVMSASTMTAEDAQRKLPGLSAAAVQKAKRMIPPRQGKNFKNDRRLLQRGVPDSVGVHLPEGVAVDAARYLEGLWEACVLQAASMPAGGACELRQEEVTCLHELHRRHKGASSITLATGAATAAVNGVPSRVADLLDLSQGYTVELRAPDGCSSDVLYPSDGPSILSMPYAAVSSSSSAIIGSTKAPVAHASDALCHLFEPRNDAAESKAIEELQSGIQDVWEPFQHWHASKVRSGVRAVPRHTNEGAPPLVGKIPRHVLESSQSTDACGWWLVTGLGVRGLLYHALMAEYLVQAIRSGDESHIPEPLRRWK